MGSYVCRAEQLLEGKGWLSRPQTLQGYIAHKNSPTPPRTIIGSVSRLVAEGFGGLDVVEPRYRVKLEHTSLGQTTWNKQAEFWPWREPFLAQKSLNCASSPHQRCAIFSTNVSKSFPLHSSVVWVSCLVAEGFGGLDVVEDRVCEMRVRQDHLVGMFRLRLLRNWTRGRRQRRSR